MTRINAGAMERFYGEHGAAVPDELARQVERRGVRRADHHGGAYRHAAADCLLGGGGGAGGPA